MTHGRFEDRSHPKWIELAQRERQAEVERFNARRSIEWRLALALWAGFGLAANALREAPLTLGWQRLTTGLAFALVVLHLAWVRNFMVRSSPENWEKGWGLTNAIREALDIADDELKLPELENSPKPGAFGTWLVKTRFVRWLKADDLPEDDPRRPRLLWGHYWQVGITFVIALLATVAVWV